MHILTIHAIRQPVLLFFINIFISVVCCDRSCATCIELIVKY